MVLSVKIFNLPQPLFFKEGSLNNVDV